MKAKKPRTNVAMTIQNQTKIVLIMDFAPGILEYWNTGIMG
jgi:hypothetical protein